MKRLVILATAATCLALPGAEVPRGRSPCIEADRIEGLRTFLHQNRPRYLAAIESAQRWLDGLRVDPTELRAKGIKGKKKLVEILDGYYRLWRIAGESQKPGLIASVERVVAITREDRYHDMLEISDRWFKQDATSYLRAAVLIERMGLDTTRYRAEIAKVHARLNGHMKHRGPHQRRVFHWYYEHFGLKEPFPLETALEDGIIAGRRDPLHMSRMDVYGLTHEVFGPYEYGDRLDVDPFTASERGYLSFALDTLTAKYIANKDPDMVAELVSCIRMIELVDLPTYIDGLSYLLSSQRADGSWGFYEREEKRLGEYVRQGYYLHTTTVTVDALSLAFHEPWNHQLKTACPP